MIDLRQGIRRRATTTAILLALCTIATGCANSVDRTGVARGDSRTGQAALDRARLDYVSLLSRGRAVSAQEWDRWRAERRTAADLVEEFSTDPFLSERVAPAILFKNSLARPASDLTSGIVWLERFEVGGQEAFYLHARCPPSQLMTVHPWWDMSSTVRVCRDSVRPGTWTTPTQTGEIAVCDSMEGARWMNPRSECGCGPALLRCYPKQDSKAFLRRMEEAARQELRATTARLVAADEPLAELFLSRSTIRTPDLERLYRRANAESLRLEDPASLLRGMTDWPAEGKFEPREELEPGQHAGVLTGPQLLFHVFERRQRMRIYFQILWCTGESAPGAQPEDTLSLHTADLSVVNEGWQELAARPVCTECHARLDYGMQYFQSYPSPTQSGHFLVGRYAGETGVFYGKNIGDRRAEAALRPHDFAEIATRQPEFAQCMARNVVEYVFGPAVTNEMVERAAASADVSALRFRGLMRIALLWLLECDDCFAVTASNAAASSGQPRFAELVDEHCTACHHDGASIPSFEGRFDPAAAPRLLDQVLSGRMPAGAPLKIETQRQFIDAWMREHRPRRDADVAARELLEAHADPMRALPLAVAREYIGAQTATRTELPELNALENAVDGRNNLLTPSYTAITAIDAYRACRAKPDVQACAGRLLDTVWKLETAR